ncbi:MAG: hypothetical protein ABSF45_21660 [Terriglobia bacterium]|jgi:hypothetical protein
MHDAGDMGDAVAVDGAGDVYMNDAVASEMGFSFVVRKPNFLGDLQLPVTLLPTGRMNPRAINFMEGTVSGMRAAIFDYLYDVRATRIEDTDTTMHNTMVVFSSTQRRLPTFDLSRKHWLPSLVKHVELEAPEFSQHFALTGSDQEGLRRVFDQRVVDLLVSINAREKLQFSGGGTWLVFLAPQSSLKPEKWRGFLQDMSQIAIALFERAGVADTAAA